MWLAWERRGKCTGFWWESWNERPLERPRHKWEDASEWILGIFAGGVEWIQLAQNRGRWWSLINTVMNLQVLAPCS
jgi:hypothetical protein